MFESVVSTERNSSAVSRRDSRPLISVVVAGLREPDARLKQEKLDRGLKLAQLAHTILKYADHAA